MQGIIAISCPLYEVYLTYKIFQELLFSHLQVISCKYQVFLLLISNIFHVLNVVFFLLGDSPVSEFYVLMFWNTLCVPSS
jgi:hypothetical protein